MSQKWVKRNCKMIHLRKGRLVSNVRGLKGNGALEGIRIPDRRYRKPVLYPAELRTHIVSILRG